MREYVSPDAELLTFESEMVMTASPVSGCNCHYDITSNTMMINGQTPECEYGETGGAEENPFGIAAPDWRLGE